MKHSALIPYLLCGERGHAIVIGKIAVCAELLVPTAHVCILTWYLGT